MTAQPYRGAVMAPAGPTRSNRRMNRLLRSAGRPVPLAFLVHQVPLVPSSPSGTVPVKRHQWSIDAVSATSMEH
jgi:hypothetical protein